MSAAEPLVTPEIRRMDEADLDAVLRIERASFSTPWSRNSFLNLLRRSDTDLWVAEIDGAVVGHAVLWYVGFEGELGNLAVAPDWRRHGLGSYLLDWALEGTRRRDIDTVFLEVRVSNRAAQDLYERRGFRRVGVRRRYYREPVEDALVMGIDLDPRP
ncbi:MAG: ribosomal protein S18-alanine N-acetyltransferase [Gemmatimonadetes bacterium]|uniref:Ribosomal protein S18-alanine N-acetyltransferase n=1 Tax=Candidatus Kutchimonas denitrificans TaxID=3056748 RepID=A0AAE4Z9D7_9BACT|nr:ribosomal protein S18-alanine N-acetyltransferase [Gemmatimonadota bacterium]NIR73901.1 ribosomal protein S18-alanine N-acetyltransferase [Candidatus Kutchimonas denitrificans]NIR99707.1 ribosomal protein S18-alanine N-acetyltransferase [Gemmatimonadota bacterium]NIT65292.1 ribosomal protein S18-alanine N-acetyltransferase [Gemmatimonadota bacterium]NIW73741.1 ribosomal protein S18-alanine N-acetyltransferase [Gemmatimonadota bacterium]